MQKTFLDFWQKLQPRERIVLGVGAVLVSCILFYSLIWFPWHRAINNMQNALPEKRSDLVWMRQQAELISQPGSIASKATLKGEGQSLMAIIEQTAKSGGVRDSIQQMVPRQNSKEVSVVLEDASFNKWVAWVDILYKDYAVHIKQLSAERDGEKSDSADIRVTFERRS